MPARLIVRIENERPQLHRIDQPVIRIGSSAGCDVVIPCFPPHLLTLQRERDEFVVINRGAGPLWLGRRLVQPQESMSWRVNDSLTAGPVQLVLSTAAEDESDYVELDSAGHLVGRVDDTLSPEKRMSRRWQLILIPVLAITTWLVVRDGSAGRIGTNVAFDRLVSEMAAMKDEDPRMDRMRLLLQHARNLELRGATHEACVKYSAIRDLLAASPHARNRQEQHLLTFVKARLVAHAN